MPVHKIIIRGAREHNLKNIDLELPRNQFIVITGVSGSENPPGLRHPLCRGAAPLRGVPVGLRPAVFGTHGQARRGVH